MDVIGQYLPTKDQVQIRFMPNKTLVNKMLGSLNPNGRDLVIDGCDSIRRRVRSEVPGVELLPRARRAAGVPGTPTGGPVAVAEFFAAHQCGGLCQQLRLRRPGELTAGEAQALAAQGEKLAQKVVKKMNWAISQGITKQPRN